MDRSDRAHDDITIDDVTYLPHGDGPLQARLYLPRAGDPASLADIHLGLRWLQSRAAAWHCRADRVA